MSKDKPQKWQVIEKDDFGTDWHSVRYDAYAMQRFDTKEEAMTAAKRYLTDLNCTNSLAAGEKRAGTEAFMMDDKGCFLGNLDGKEWYMDYRQNVTGKLPDGSKGIIHNAGDIVANTSYFELEGKIQVAVRVVPGT